jgi:hypothetical protein
MKYILILVVSVAVVGGGIYYLKTSTTMKNEPSNIDVPSESSDTPTDTMAGTKTSVATHICDYLSDSDASRIIGKNVTGVFVDSDEGYCQYDGAQFSVRPLTSSDKAGMRDIDSSELLVGIGDRARWHNPVNTLVNVSVIKANVYVSIAAYEKDSVQGNLEIAKKIATAVVTKIKK